MTTHEKLKADLQKELGELFSTINPITILTIMNLSGNKYRKEFINLLAEYAGNDPQTILFLGMEFADKIQKFMKIWDNFESEAKKLQAEEN